MNLHSEAVVHESQSRWADVHGNVLGNRRSLVQTSELEDSTNSLLSAPWTTAGEHLKDHTSKGPYINLGAVALALRLDDLRSHPEHGTLHRVGRIVSVDVVSLLGDTEVRDSATAVKIEKDVVCFQVAVQDSLVVQVCQSIECLAREGLHDTLLELAVFAETATDRTTRDILEVNRDGKFTSLTSQILHNVRVLKVLHRVDFLVQSGNHVLDSIPVLSGNSRVDVHLFDSQDFTIVGVHAQIHPSKRSLANKLTTDDTEGWLSLRHGFLSRLVLRDGVKLVQPSTGSWADLHDLRAKHLGTLATKYVA